MPFCVQHNVNSKRFEMQVGNEPLAFLSYTRDGDRVSYDHTFIPDALRGRGLATTLIRTALDEARRQKWKIVPRCSSVARFMTQHPEFSDLLNRQEID
jgi:uncharacterized protein